MCRWRLIGCGLLAVSGLALILGAAARKNFKAAEKVLARHVILVGREPTLGSWLVGDEDTPSLLLFDQQGAVRAGLSILEEGRPSLGFLDMHGQSWMVLTLEPNGSPMMRWLNAQGQFSWSAQEKNAENLLIVRDQALAAQYTQNWDTHWQHSQSYVGLGANLREVVSHDLERESGDRRHG
jgi:hypothetical protein